VTARAPQDSTGRPIAVGDRVSWRGQLYMIKAFHVSHVGTRSIEFEEPQHIKGELPEEHAVDLVTTNKDPAHVMQGPPGHRCSCGIEFGNYDAHAEHVRLSITCPRCGAAPADLGAGEAMRWACGHWIARSDISAAIRTGMKEEANVEVPRTICRWCGGDCPRWGADTCPLRPRQLPREDVEEK